MMNNDDAMIVRQFLGRDTGRKMLEYWNANRPKIDLTEQSRAAMSAAERMGYEKAIELFLSVAAHSETPQESPFME